ncbi:CotH kinase family protein [Elizabethkingia ursingii]|uniref:CotH kinase family protein n=1 Tax=Elizabethkingia ursingii TaxID=1756150 RepID=UPI002011E2A1|nr:CotH kinase family protein [Elizabethkingia ursingii]MCL1666380.1 CotH kinase family protein [Elizabethkingia ursingii]
MEVNKELISYIKASELPKIGNPVSGDLIHAQGDNLSTTPISYFIDKISSGIYGRLTTSTVVSGSGYYKYDVAQAGTYTNINPAITITQQELDENFVFVTVNNGVAEKLLSKKPSSKVDTWISKTYEKTNQVFHNGAIYEASVDIQAGDVPGESDKWRLIMVGFSSIGNANLLEFAAKDGSGLFTIDKDGYLWANYAPNSISKSVIQGLPDDIKILYEGAFKKEYKLDLLQILTKDESVSISQEKDGTIYIPRLRTDDLDYNKIKPEIKKEIFKGGFYDIPELSQLKLNFSITFPVDLGDIRRGTVDFMIGERILFTANCEISVQGNYSASWMVPKKGFTLDLFNADWKKLKVKTGKLPALDSFHLKAYWTDVNKVKELFNMRLWKQLILSRPYPESSFKILNPTISTSLEQSINSSEAPFVLDGTPTVVLNQGSFMGCYILRMKKHATVFALDTKNQNHILLDSQIYNVGIGNKSAYATYEGIATDYEVRSPKTPSQKAKDSMIRFFGYMRDVYEGRKSFSGTYQDYLVLNGWVDFLLQCELIGHWDTIVNNAMYITYDGIHWMPVLIDTDFTLGVAEVPFGKVHPAPTGTNSWYIGNKDVFPKFRAQLLPEIKARYTQVRNTVLSMENMTNLLTNIGSSFSRSDIEADLKKWGVVTLPEAIESTDNILRFLQDRKDFLDSKFL